MMSAYDESYLNDAQDTLGGMLDYAARDCGRDPDEFFGWFVASGVATLFGRGNPRFVAGMSGVELAREVFLRVTGSRACEEPSLLVERSSEYWCGWALAYYQWLRALRYEDMLQCGLVPSVLLARSVLHEADISKFVGLADSLMTHDVHGQTRLRKLRRERGLTQAELAEAAGVKLRMVQLYEQRQNDLSKASVSVVIRLSNAIGCQVEDLLDPVSSCTYVAISLK